MPAFSTANVTREEILKELKDLIKDLEADKYRLDRELVEIKELIAEYSAIHVKVFYASNHPNS